MLLARLGGAQDVSWDALQHALSVINEGIAVADPTLPDAPMVRRARRGSCVRGSTSLPFGGRAAPGPRYAARALHPGTVPEGAGNWQQRVGLQRAACTHAAARPRAA